MGKIQIPRPKTSDAPAFLGASRAFAPARRGAVQTKLTLGPVGDHYEKEADTAAHQVVQQMAAPGVTQRASQDDELLDTKLLPGAVQRVGAPPKDDELDKVMTKPAAGAVQREGGAGGGPIGADVESSIEGARSGGRSLDKGVRAAMEPAFGADFSGVRVHSDAQSDSLNRSLQARAFTTGQDVFFRSGEYNPGSSGGQELLAHELTHVVQQNGSTVMKKPESGGPTPLDSYLGSRVADRDVPVVGNRFGEAQAAKTAKAKVKEE